MLRRLIPTPTPIWGALTLSAMVILGLPHQAHAACTGEQTEALYGSERSCPEEIRKVSCDGRSIDLQSEGPACCTLKASKSVKWRCGTDEALTFKCKGRGKDARFLSVRHTSAGLMFVCVGDKVLEVTEQPTEEGAVSTGASGGAGGSE